MADARSAAAALAASALIAAPTGAAPNARAARADARAALSVAAAAPLSPAEQKQADEERAAEDDADAAADAANATQGAAAQQQDRDEAEQMDPAEFAAMLRAHRIHQSAATQASKAAAELQAQGLGLGAASQAPPLAADTAALLHALMQGQRQQAEQMVAFQVAAADEARRQQSSAAAAQLILQSLGDLPAFDGKGVDTTLTANEWLRRTELYFGIRERALGMSAAAGDQARVMNADYVLQSVARLWFDALTTKPTTWAEFVKLIKQRFCSVPAERIRSTRLKEFVAQAARASEKLSSVVAMQIYTAKFAQLAGEVPDSWMTTHTKLGLLAEGLPLRFREFVAKEDAKDPPPTLDAVIAAVLARAAHKEAYGGSSTSAASAASAAPLNLDAIAMVQSMCGLSRSEAASYFEGTEGWKPHDTDAAPQFRSQETSSSGPAAASSSPTMGMADWQQQIMFNALSLKFDPNRQGNDRGNGTRSRRNAPSSITKEVPAELIAARKEAGLCMKCGIHEYTPGSQGHNSNTCRANIDKTTSAAEGKKKANFQGARR